MTLAEDVAAVLEKLNKATAEGSDYRGEIVTNTKGEASFKIRVFSNSTQEIGVAAGQIYDEFVKLCRDKGIKIAGS